MNTIFFDFGRVLGHFDHMKACGALAAHTDVPPGYLKDWYFGNKEEERRITGRLSGPGFYREVVRDLKLPPTFSYGAFAALWGDIFAPAEPAINSLLKQVRPGVRKFITSNTEVLHWPYINALPAVRAHFGKGSQVLSFRVGFRKPDRAYFEEALRRARARPQDVLYLDDVPQYVDMFRSLGGCAEVFDLTKDQPSHLRDILERYGTLL